MADLRAVLAGIYAQRGELSAQIVVDEARPGDSVLHHRFEWDDSIAGESYRRVQATELIRSVRIVYAEDSGTGELKRVRAFYSRHQAGDTDSRGYAPVEELKEDEFASKLLLRQCELEIAGLKRRYGHLNEFVALMRSAAEEVA